MYEFNFETLEQGTRNKEQGTRNKNRSKTELAEGKQETLSFLHL